MTSAEMAKEIVKRRKHDFYYAIPAYQILARKTSAEIAKELGITERSYYNKVHGMTDFTVEQSMKLCSILNRTMDELFLV